MMLFLAANWQKFLGIAIGGLIFYAINTRSELQDERRISECADAIIKSDSDLRAKKCPADVDRAVQTLLDNLDKDVAETKVEYRDRIVPIYNEQQGVDRTRERQLERDLDDLRKLVDQGTACSTSDAISTVRHQLCVEGEC
mgnify:CR=1 FL=1